MGGITPFSVVLSEQPWSAVAGGAGSHIDLLIGSNTEEAALYLASSGQLGEMTRDDVLAAAARFHPDPAALVEAYLDDLPGADEATLLTAVTGDGMFGTGTERLARAHASTAEARTYRYEFGWRSSAVEGLLGSGHTVELPFVFDIADWPELHRKDALLGARPAPVALQRAMHGAWAAFVSTGDPGWPEYDTGQLLLQCLDTDQAVRPFTRPRAFGLATEPAQTTSSQF